MRYLGIGITSSLDVDLQRLAHVLQLHHQSTENSPGVSTSEGASSHASAKELLLECAKPSGWLIAPCRDKQLFHQMAERLDILTHDIFGLIGRICRYLADNDHFLHAGHANSPP